MQTEITCGGERLYSWQMYNVVVQRCTSSSLENTSEGSIYTMVFLAGVLHLLSSSF